MVLMGHLLQRVDRFTLDQQQISALRASFLFFFADPFAGCGILFCISGYTLCSYIGRTLNSSARNVLVSYLFRRLMRLWTPYFVVLMVTFIFLKITGYNPVGTNQYYTVPTSLTMSLFGSLTFTHDLAFGTFPRLFPPGWFIETLVQFYIIGQFFINFYLRLSNEKDRIWLGLCLLIFFLGAASINVQYGPKETQYSLMTFMPYLWTGVILADLELFSNGHPLRRALRNTSYLGWPSLGVFFIFGAPFGNGILRLAALIICLFFIFNASFAAGTRFQRAMVGRWLTRIGVASYAIFLVHLQILQVTIPIILHASNIMNIFPAFVVCGMVCVPLVMAVSVAFYWLVERPFVVAAKRISLITA